MSRILACIAVVLTLSPGAVAVSAMSQRDEGRLGNTRTSVGTNLPDFSDLLQRSVQSMTDAFDAARSENLDPGFRILLDETEAFASKIEALYGARTSEAWSRQELVVRSKDIAEATNRLTDLVNYGTDPPRINVAPLPVEGLDVRIRRLVIVSRRLIPNIFFLVGADKIDLDLLNQIRDDLAITGALTRALPGSEF